MLFLLADGMSHSKLTNLTPNSCRSHYFGHLKVERSVLRLKLLLKAVASVASMVAIYPLGSFGLCGRMSKLPTQTTNFHVTLSNGTEYGQTRLCNGM